MNYSEFTARIALIAGTDLSVDVDLVAIMPAMIDAAERKVAEDLDPLAFRRVAVLTTAAGVQTPTGMPADWWVPRGLTLAGPPRVRLERRRPDFLEAYAPDPSVTGTPKYWALLDDVTVVLAPTPAGVLTLRADYIARPAGLSVSNPTTWLGTNYAELLLYAALVFLAGYQKNYGAGDDPKQAPFWAAQYTEQLARAQLAESKKRGLTSFEPPPTPAPVAGTAG